MKTETQLLDDGFKKIEPEVQPVNLWENMSDTSITPAKPIDRKCLSIIAINCFAVTLTALGISFK